MLHAFSRLYYFGSRSEKVRFAVHHGFPFNQLNKALFRGGGTLGGVWLTSPKISPLGARVSKVMKKLSHPCLEFELGVRKEDGLPGMILQVGGLRVPSLVEGNWLVLSDEQMSKRLPFSPLNDEQMSNWVGIKHLTGKFYAQSLDNKSGPVSNLFFVGGHDFWRRGFFWWRY